MSSSKRFFYSVLVFIPLVMGWAFLCQLIHLNEAILNVIAGIVLMVCSQYIVDRVETYRSVQSWKKNNL